MPTELTSALVQALVVIIAALGSTGATLLITGAQRAKINSKNRETEAEEKKTQADERALAVREKQALLTQFESQARELRRLKFRLDKVANDYMEEVRRGNAQEDRITALQKQLDEMGMELAQVKEARDEAREKSDSLDTQLNSERDAWAVERANLNTKIDGLEEQVRQLTERFDFSEATRTKEVTTVTPEALS